MVNKKKVTIKVGPVIISALFSIFTGVVFSYCVLTKTTIIPINFSEKFKQYYIEQERADYESSYIDLTNGFIFNYPGYYKVQNSIYSVDKDTIEKRVNLDVSYGDSVHTLLRYKLDKLSLMDFANKNDVFPWQDRRGVEYQKKIINGYDAVIGEFEVTEEQKELEEFIKGGMQKIINEPLGFKEKIVYIEHNGDVYIWKTGGIDNLGELKDFDLIVNSFKFIY